MRGIKTQRGITLITLIITIVVLMILSVTVIFAIHGEDILVYANTAVSLFKEEEEEEQNVINKYDDMLSSGKVLEQNGTQVEIATGGEKVTVKVGTKITNYNARW